MALAVLDANIATAVIAGFALAGAVWTLRHADATARRTLTASYNERWDHPDLLRARVLTSEFLTLDGITEDERWKEWAEKLGHAESIQIMAILNYWEEVASAYNQGFLDNDWFRSDLAWVLVDNWDRAAWFIRKYRHEEMNASFYREWQVAVQAVRPDLTAQLDEGRRRAEEAVELGEDLLYAA